MASDERIKVIFHRVYVKDDADTFGSGEFYFQASVDDISVGNPNTIYNAVEHRWIDLPEREWSRVVNVRRESEVMVRFQGKDEDVTFDDDLGTITHRLRRPWRQRRYRHSTQYYILEWSVELAVDGRFGRHAPNAVFACRARRGAGVCTTVSGARVVSRLEIHEVRPTPTTGLPPRPTFPAGTGPAVTNGGNTNVRPSDPINIIPNPAVIPVLAPAAANNQTAARIEFTYYRPNTLGFTDNDRRLVWSAVSLSGGGAVRFVGKPHGLKVLVYGTHAGAVRLEVRFRGALLATYRALVMPVKQIPCRFNILNGPSRRSTPRSTPGDIVNHLAIANRFLRQVALQLTLDTNPMRHNGARATGTPGIFRIRVRAGRTRNIGVTGFARATRLNYRHNVMNFAYIHSDSQGNLGAATDYPASNAGASITDTGTPSTSWISPTGVPPDAASGNVVMSLLAARQRSHHPHLFAMYVTDANGDPSVLAAQQTYAGTIAHELGHILNLPHRVDKGGSPFNDGLNYPPGENLMHWNNPTTLAQDLDIIQALAIHQSPLVPP